MYDRQDFCSRPLEIISYKKAVGIMVSEKKIFKVYKSMETLYLQGGASLDPRGLIGRSYVGD